MPISGAWTRREGTALALLCGVAAGCTHDTASPAQIRNDTVLVASTLDLATTALPLGIGRTGRLVGWQSDAQDRARAVTWTAGAVVTFLPVPDDGREGIAVATNSGGSIVGYRIVSTEFERAGDHAALWQNGAFVDLAPPGDMDVSAAMAINDAGLVVGQASHAGLGGTRAVLWQNGRATVLDTLGFGDSGAYSVNMTGDIVGFTTINGKEHAARWHAGKITDLGIGGGIQSGALGINDAGDVAGFVQDAAYNLLPVFWHGGTLTQIPLLAGFTDATADAVTDAGVVIGTLQQQPGDKGFRAFAWRGGKYTLLPLLPGDSASMATAASPGGTVVGVSYGPSSMHTVMWTLKTP